MSSKKPGGSAFAAPRTSRTGLTACRRAHHARSPAQDIPPTNTFYEDDESIARCDSQGIEDAQWREYAFWRRMGRSWREAPLDDEPEKPRRTRSPRCVAFDVEDENVEPNLNQDSLLGPLPFALEA